MKKSKVVLCCALEQRLTISKITLVIYKGIVNREAEETTEETNNKKKKKRKRRREARKQAKPETA